MNKKYLPNLTTFKQLMENPEYWKGCLRADCLIGPDETLDYVNMLLKKNNIKTLDKTSNIDK